MLRGKYLKHIEGDLRTTEQAADRMTGDFEEMDAIFRAARAAHHSLSEYGLELMPQVSADAA